MDNLEKKDHAEVEDEDFPNEFQCCLCLDLLYKPVVLACGHIACFWCVFQAMDTWQESQCPICRKLYTHFPSICQLLHFLLLRMYPLAYERRVKQMTEEEEKFESSSPQLEYSLSESQSTSKQVHVTDMSCARCKQLLYRPIVLNCGHVYCEVCIINPNEKVCRCQVCPSVHPEGFPKVCKILEHFLEENFPAEYTSRKEAVLDEVTCKLGSPSTSSTDAEKRVNFLSGLSGKGPKVHFAVGCDYCGAYPILGERYHCKDCKEKVGFDLCEKCYSSSSKLPGRFNQQHTPEHEFEVVEAPHWIVSEESDASQDQEGTSD